VSFRDSFFGEIEITWYTIALPKLIFGEGIVVNTGGMDNEHE
jgi:hypothetical protein